MARRNRIVTSSNKKQKPVISNCWWLFVLPLDRGRRSNGEEHNIVLFFNPTTNTLAITKHLPTLSRAAD